MNKYITTICLGVNSGLIYALLGSTLTAYLDDSNISLVVIGLLSFRMIPYSFKPLWSPFVDNLHIGFIKRSFGQRKSWAILPQVILIICLIFLGHIDVERHVNLFFSLALFTAFMGASSDVALDGYRIELFENESASKANALTIFGFRIGLFISGSIGLYLAVIYPWPIVFLLMGIFLIPGLIVIFLSADDRILPQGRSGEGIKLWFRDNFIYAIHSLFIRKKIFYILLLIGFYKVSDGYLDTMLLPFLDQMGFSKLDVANAKAIGIVTGIAGNFLGVKIIHKFGMHLGLLGAEVFASISNLFFLFLVYFGKSDMLLFILNGTESFFSGISNIVLMSYMSSMCNNKKFTASHFAILTSFSMIFRTLLSCTSGLVVIQAGWQSFFITSALLSIPSLLCIYFLFFRNKRTYL